MARYDYDDERTGESDKDADDYPRRAPDYPPARRDSLMQRRLRAARGEEAEAEEIYDDDYAPPGSMMAPYGQPSQPGLPPATQAKPKSAAVTPGKPPVPRKRPSSAPQEAAGSVEALQAAPALQPAAPQKPASPAPSEKPVNAMPPELL